MSDIDSPPPSPVHFSHPQAVVTSDASSTFSTDTAITMPDSTPVKEPSVTDDDQGHANAAADDQSNKPTVYFSANDDSVIQYEPSRHVDYLSHNWQESDISSSWRYIVLRRKDMANSARLENASWRTWTKAKYNLRTVSPESVNWLKDYDVTWLYGPLYTQPSRHSVDSSGVLSPPTRSAPVTTSSGKKPILKKRSMSEVMLSRSVSSSNLLKQAAASVKAQRHLRAPGTKPTTSSYSSSAYGYVTDVTQAEARIPAPLISRSYAASSANFSDRNKHWSRTDDTEKQSSQKHIHFSDRVEQCIALEEDDDYGNSSKRFGNLRHSTLRDDDDEDDEDDDDEPGLFLMVRSGSGSFQRPASLEPHTIAKLPATKLKYVQESPDDRRPTRAAFFSMVDDDEDSDDGFEEHDGNYESAVYDNKNDFNQRQPTFKNDRSDKNNEIWFGNEDSDDDMNTDGTSANYADNDDYLSRSRSRSGRESNDFPTSRYDVSETSPERPVLVSRSSSFNLSEQPRSSFREISPSARGQEYANEYGDDSSDDDIVEMDSTLMSNLRRDSVVLTRQRIPEFLQPETSTSKVTETPVPSPSIQSALKPMELEIPSTHDEEVSTGRLEDSHNTGIESVDQNETDDKTNENRPQSVLGSIQTTVNATRDMFNSFFGSLSR
ncbi:hypothetical protein V1511DRAFT_487582 [Dipodascopsis uninucleata]